MSDVQIFSPGPASKGPRGVPFNVRAGHQLIEPLQGAAGLQFSNHADGPWTTCRPAGGGGAIEAPAIPYSAQINEFAWLVVDGNGVVANEAAWFRAGVWPDQDLTGEPVAASPAVHRDVLVVTPQEEPEAHS